MDNMVSEGRALEGRQGGGEEDMERQTQQFNGMVLAGKLHQAVRRATNQEGGGVLYPDNRCTKTGEPVLDVLQGKHPDTRVPDVENPKCTAFEDYAEVPEVIPLDFTAGSVAFMANKLQGSAGPMGQEAVAVKDWFLQFGKAPEELREEMVSLADWLANESPPWAAYRALMACRLVVLDKFPSVRPMGIGEILRCLTAKMVIRACGDEAKVACGNLQLCAGLEAGIEGAEHAVRLPLEAQQAVLQETAPGGGEGNTAAAEGTEGEERAQ
eukprot:12767712-Ditylum_brightwellii.AAC.1